MTAVANILLDTDILVDYLRGLEISGQFFEGLTFPVAVSSITVAELFCGVREGKERSALTALLKLCQIEPVTYEIAQRAGLLRRDYSKSHGVGLADAIIAATALEIGAKLTTKNIKHYPMIDNLKAPY